MHSLDEHALYLTTSRPRRSAGSLSTAWPPRRPGRRPPPSAPTGTANRMTMDHDGRLVVCEQGARDSPARISRIERGGGEIETLVDAVDGAPLDSPNDVIVASDGAVRFTEPNYGHLQGSRPPPALADRVSGTNRRPARSGPSPTASTGRTASCSRPTGERRRHVVHPGPPGGSGLMSLRSLRTALPRPAKGRGGARRPPRALGPAAARAGVLGDPTLRRAASARLGLGPPGRHSSPSRLQSPPAREKRHRPGAKRDRDAQCDGKRGPEAGLLDAGEPEAGRVHQVVDGIEARQRRPRLG